MQLAPFWAIIGPSAAGKSSLEKAILERIDSTGILLTYTTRPPRVGEHDGEDCRFVTQKEYIGLRSTGSLLTDVENFGFLYGTLRTELNELRLKARLVIAILNAKAVEQAWLQGVDLKVICLVSEELAILQRRLRERHAHDWDRSRLHRRLQNLLPEMSDAHAVAAMGGELIINFDGEFEATVVEALALINRSLRG